MFAYSFQEILSYGGCDTGPSWFGPSVVVDAAQILLLCFAIVVVFVFQEMCLFSFRNGAWRGRTALVRFFASLVFLLLPLGLLLVSAFKRSSPVSWVLAVILREVLRWLRCRRRRCGEEGVGCSPGRVILIGETEPGHSTAQYPLPKAIAARVGRSLMLAGRGFAVLVFLRVGYDFLSATVEWSMRHPFIAGGTPAVLLAIAYEIKYPVIPKASMATIKQARRQLVLRFHPDKNHLPGASVKFRLVQNAYKCLSDPLKRQSYDRHVSLPKKPIIAPLALSVAPTASFSVVVCACAHVLNNSVPDGDNSFVGVDEEYPFAVESDDESVPSLENEDQFLEDSPSVVEPAGVWHDGLRRSMRIAACASPRRSLRLAALPRVNYKE